MTDLSFIIFQVHLLARLSISSASRLSLSALSPLKKLLPGADHDVM